MSAATPVAKLSRSIEALRSLADGSAFRERAALILILLAATFFRANHFEAAPPGLQHDEVFKANFALEILDGGWPVFFDANGGEEVLFPYLAALFIRLVGPNFLALRLVSLVCGLLSLALGHRLAKELFGRRVALLTTAMLAVSFWHIFDSRVALRPITLLMMALASYLSFWVGLRRGGVLPFVLAGVSLGGSLHTYTSGLLVPATIVLFVVFYLLPFRRALLVQRWRGILLALTIALIIFLPLGYHVAKHPAASTARARDLSDHVSLLLAGEPGPLLRDTLNVAGMFGFRGDPEWRYNLAGRPVFDPLTFVLFCLGLGICLARIRQPEYAFLLMWLVINIIPSAITRHSPSTLRAIGSLTAIYVLPALPLGAAWDRVEHRFGARGIRVLVAAVVLLLAGNASLTYRDYFAVWANNPEVRDIYRADLSAVARFLKDSVGDEVVCVSASFAADLDQQGLTFMMGERWFIRWFDGHQALTFPSAESWENVLYIFPATGPLREDLASRFFLDLAVHHIEPDPSGQPAFVAYRVGPEELSRLRSLQPAHALLVDLEGRAEVLGYELSSPVTAGDALPLLLYWRVPQPIRPDLQYSFFAHLVDMRGYLWDQVDTLGYPVSNWIEGDLVVQVFDLAVPADAPPVDYQVKLGMYDEVTGARLMPRVGGMPQPQGTVSTEPFSVKRAETPPRPEDLKIPRERYASFEGLLTLLGGDVGTPAVGRGEPVPLSLYWQAQRRPPQDYVVSILVTDESGDVLDEILREPVDGLYPTTLWRQGEVVRDRFDVVIGLAVPEGRHRLWVRLWDPDARRYLTLSGSQEDRVRLGRVYVAPGPGE